MRDCTCNNYGCLMLLLDLVLIGVTGGLWIIWILIREMRRGNCRSCRHYC